jgi:PAS domain S-box-containing protein
VFESSQSRPYSVPFGSTKVCDVRATVRLPLLQPSLSDMSTSAVKRGEELYAMLVQSVKDYAIFMLDPRGRVATWNDGAERIKGYTAEEIIGRHFATFYPVEDVLNEKPKMELETAIRVGRFEDFGWRVRKDGTQFWANVVITAVRDSDGELVGFAKVTRDLTERREAELRALNDARRVAAAEAANRTKAEFLATLSHELRTPLNAIAGYAELMELGVGGTITEQQATYLARIRRSQEHLLGIINDLLNYSRLETVRPHLEFRAINLHSLIEDTLAMIRVSAATKHVTVVKETCPAGLHAWADEQKLAQITLNLLSNAVKFTPSGGRITVSCDAARDRVTIHVRDNGPGIDADNAGAVFEPFVQLGRSASTPKEGIGLGLAISRDLARAMKGDITLESTPGKGATFSIVLPSATPSSASP